MEFEMVKVSHRTQTERVALERLHALAVQVNLNEELLVQKIHSIHPDYLVGILSNARLNGPILRRSRQYSLLFMINF